MSLCASYIRLPKRDVCVATDQAGDCCCGGDKRRCQYYPQEREESMKEYTHIYTLQVTDIIKGEDPDGSVEKLLQREEYKRAQERRAKADLDAEDVKVIDSKIFVRDV